MKNLLFRSAALLLLLSICSFSGGGETKRRYTKGHYHAVHKKINQVKKKFQSGTDESAKASKLLRTLGWVFFAVGMAFTIVTIIFGWAYLLAWVFLAIIGLLAAVIGQVLSLDKKDSAQLRDVVYLKNGSIVKGTIIEQVPNVSLKIKTADGSIFVYKMDEVEKLTKE